MHITKHDVCENLTNESIDYVVKLLNEYLDTHDVDICCCKSCLIDVVALTLNDVNSRYRLLGRHAHKEIEQVKRIHSEINVAIEKAIPLVKDRPHHE